MKQITALRTYVYAYNRSVIFMIHSKNILNQSQETCLLYPQARQRLNHINQNSNLSLFQIYKTLCICLKTRIKFQPFSPPVFSVIFSFLSSALQIIVCPFVPFLLAIVLSVLLRFTDLRILITHLAISNSSYINILTFLLLRSKVSWF